MKEAGSLSGDRARVERQAEDRWRVWPADETWLRLLAAGALTDETACAAVIKEHPQHEGVLLQGPLEGLQASARALRARLLELPRSFPLVLPDFATAVLVRRALMTRPVCLAAVSVAFTDAVDCIELEPQAAHRIGQLAFWTEAAQLRRHADLPLVVPAGQEALAQHLRLPDGVRLVPELASVRLGVRAAPGAEPVTVALVTLEPGSVRAQGHSKFMSVTSPSYWPRWRLARQDARSLERVAALGLRVGDDGVLLGRARREVLAHRGVELQPLPAGVELDFECLGFERREQALEAAYAQLLDELDEVVAQLPEPVRANGAASECPDVPSGVRCGGTA